MHLNSLSFVSDGQALSMLFNLLDGVYDTNPTTKVDVVLQLSKTIAEKILKDDMLCQSTISSYCVLTFIMFLLHASLCTICHWMIG